MSKLDINVGDEFPLDEGAPHRGRPSHGHAHHHHHRRFGLERFALLLVVAGLAALIVNHQMTAAMAYGLIGAGAALLVLCVLIRAAWHWRHHHRTAQVS